MTTFAHLVWILIPTFRFFFNPGMSYSLCVFVCLFHRLTSHFVLIHVCSSVSISCPLRHKHYATGGRQEMTKRWDVSCDKGNPPDMNTHVHRLSRDPLRSSEPRHSRKEEGKCGGGSLVRACVCLCGSQTDPEDRHNRIRVSHCHHRYSHRQLFFKAFCSKKILIKFSKKCFDSKAQLHNCQTVCPGIVTSRLKRSDLRDWFTDFHVLAEWKKSLSGYNCVPRSHAETVSVGLPKEGKCFTAPFCFEMCSLCWCFMAEAGKKNQHFTEDMNIYIHFDVFYDQIWKILSTSKYGVQYQHSFHLICIRIDVYYI